MEALNLTNDEQNVIKQVLRWRLILGRFSERSLFRGNNLGGLGSQDLLNLMGLKGRGGGQLEDEEGESSSDPFGLELKRAKDIDEALSFLYDRDFSYPEDQAEIIDEILRKGSPTGAFAMRVPTWINKIKTLFPKEIVEILQKDAINKYGITEILTDPEVLERIEPNLDMVKLILSFKGMMNRRTLEIAKRIIRQVVEELKNKILNEVQTVFTGTLNRNVHSPVKVAKNLDIKTTIRRNLIRWNNEEQRLYLQDVYFWSRVHRRREWHIIVCIDQSGSMTNSVVHSAIMGSIFASIKSLKTSLVVFDTKVVDLSDNISDPVEVLLSVQLGGGTNIGKAMRYCKELITTPARTIIVLLSDFFEGYSEENLVYIVSQIHEMGVKQIGLAALDYQSEPMYDKHLAQKLADHGMSIGVLTPKELAEHVMDLINEEKL